MPSLAWAWSWFSGDCFHAHASEGMPPDVPRQKLNGCFHTDQYSTAPAATKQPFGVQPKVGLWLFSGKKRDRQVPTAVFPRLQYAVGCPHPAVRRCPRRGSPMPMQVGLRPRPVARIDAPPRSRLRVRPSHKTQEHEAGALLSLQLTRQCNMPVKSSLADRMLRGNTQ